MNYPWRKFMYLQQLGVNGWLIDDHCVVKWFRTASLQQGNPTTSGNLETRFQNWQLEKGFWKPEYWCWEWWQKKFTSVVPNKIKRQFFLFVPSTFNDKLKSWKGMASFKQLLALHLAPLFKRWIHYHKVRGSAWIFGSIELPILYWTGPQCCTVLVQIKLYNSKKAILTALPSKWCLRTMCFCQSFDIFKWWCSYIVVA